MSATRQPLCEACGLETPEPRYICALIEDQDAYRWIVALPEPDTDGRFCESCAIIRVAAYTTWLRRAGPVRDIDVALMGTALEQQVDAGTLERHDGKYRRPTKALRQADEIARHAGDPLAELLIDEEGRRFLGEGGDLDPPESEP